MKITRTILLVVVCFALLSCSEEKPSDVTARLLLSRRPGGTYAIELVGAPENARALQAVVSVASSETFTLEDARPPDGRTLDTVRMRAAGQNRAILFAGDKRGVLLPRSGDVARFSASGPGGEGRLSITSALLSSDEGSQIPLELGPSLSIR